MTFPAWLGELQRDFGAMLRTPLRATPGNWEVTPELFPAALLDAAAPGPRSGVTERLAVYNRQYWFRLLNALHQAYPLVTRLFGHRDFNHVAVRYLTAAPPRTGDLDDVPDDFAPFLSSWVADSARNPPRSPNGPDLSLVAEAIRFETAWRRVFAAPLATPLFATQLDAQRIPHVRLKMSESATLIETSYPLFELRSRALSESGEAPLLAPDRFASAQHRLLLRTPKGMAQRQLERTEARLLALLGEMPFGEALGRLEAELSDSERTLLPAQAGDWLARSMRFGLWTGFED